MVLGVCRRVLGNRHAAEDAFQATFLVLARKATAIAKREQLASWLHGVARRAALDARRRAARQHAKEKRLSIMSPADGMDEIQKSELRSILDDELSRLPDRHRAAIVLCELEGLSRREAACRLGVSEGTLSSRLARAKIQATRAPHTTGPGTFRRHTRLRIDRGCSGTGRPTIAR